MTEEQKFIFDLKGYLLIPEVLKPSEIAALKAQINTVWVWHQGGPDNGKNLRYED